MSNVTSMKNPEQDRFAVQIAVIITVAAVVAVLLGKPRTYDIPYLGTTPPIGFTIQNNKVDVPGPTMTFAEREALVAPLRPAWVNKYLGPTQP